MRTEMAVLARLISFGLYCVFFVGMIGIGLSFFLFESKVLLFAEEVTVPDCSDGLRGW